MIIHLDSEEVQICLKVAQAMEQKLGGRPDFHSHSVESSLSRKVRGYLAEGAVAKMTGYQWHTFNPRAGNRLQEDRLRDVGPIEVRSNKPGLDLMLKKGEALDATPLVLVFQHSESVYEVAGWRFAFEMEKFWAPWMPDPCWKCGPERLWSLESLESWCADQPGGSRWTETHLGKVVFSGPEKVFTKISF